MSETIVQLRDGRVVHARTKWYGSVRVFSDGSMRFSPWAYRGVSHVTIKGGLVSPSVFISGRQVMLLCPWPRRLISACFVYTLTADELRYAVQTLCKVYGGLEGWIVPALEWMQGDPNSMRPNVLEILPELLESCRGLPVSPVWKRRRRETQRAWVKRLETHPEGPMVTAPWMLPENYNPPIMATKRSRATR